MESTLLARQAIYDADLNVAAYELLFRSNEYNKADLDKTEASVATSTVVSNAIINLGIPNIVNDLPVHINFPLELLKSLDTKPFHEKLIIELGLPEVIDSELIHTIKQLKANNYKIAFDGFVKHDSKYVSELLHDADIIKIDVNSHSKNDVASILKDVSGFKGQLCANKLESKKLFEHYHEIGFDLFQGYFLSYPNKIKGKSVAQNKLLLLQILAKLQDPNIDIEELSHLIRRDAMLCYKILRIVNSAMYSPADRKLDSINEAVIRLGLDQIKFWTSLVVLTAINENVMGIIEITLVRAQMCSNLAKLRGYDSDRQNTFFTVGLLSSIDAILNDDMETILSKLPLATELNSALVAFDGELGNTLAAVMAYQKSEFDSIDFSVNSEEEFTEAYVTSIQWTDDILRSFEKIN